MAGLVNVHENKSFRIAFIHPDLGIGGAERLVVDAAVGLQELGHDVEIITSWHDPNHCFEQTRDGTLKVHHAKTTIPRTILGSFHLPLAILRQLSLLSQLLVALLIFRYPGLVPRFLYHYATVLPPMQGFDVFIVDQLSACLPALRILTTTRVIFYCHYPDKDVGNSIARQKALERGQSGPGLLRLLYRIPFDFLEEMTISTADKIMVNSNFTSKQFVKTFFRLARFPRIVYPGIDVEQYSEEKIKEAYKRLSSKENDTSDQATIAARSCIRLLMEKNDRLMLLSINRFEAKKDIALAIASFVETQREYAALGHTPPLQLILAGGYDYRLRDNVMTLKELQGQCDANSLSHISLFYNPAHPSESPRTTPSVDEVSMASVIFLPSTPYAILASLLSHPQTKALLYTPTDEHFGIVPLEAMAVGLPVLATNTGGPVESVAELDIEQSSVSAKGDGSVIYSNRQGTGLLRRANAKVWAKATLDLLALSEEQRKEIAHNAKIRTERLFSLQTMSKEFEKCIAELDDKGAVGIEEGLLQWTVAIGMFIFMMGTYIAVVRNTDLK